MAEPNFPGSVTTADKEEEESDEEDEQKAKGKTKGSVSKYGDVCPHKAYPPMMVKRNLLKTQKDYINFLLRNPREGHPWYSPAEKIKFQSRSEASYKWLEQARKLKLRAKPSEDSGEKEMDMSRYIIMEHPDKPKKRKKKKVPPLGYQIKINEELAFLLDVVVQSKEIMIQKGIDYQRQKEEDERRAKEEGDLKVLKKIVQGMMFKVMKEYEESVKEKPPKKKSKKEKGKGKNKKGKKKREVEEKGEEEEDKEGKSDDREEKALKRQARKMNENTTKELVAFLKVLVEQDKKKRDATYEEKSVSPYASEELISSLTLEEMFETEIIEEEEEDEGEEDNLEGEEEEGEGEEKKEDDEEGVVDMEEVKRKLEALQEAEEEGEQEGSEPSLQKASVEEGLSAEESLQSEGSEVMGSKPSMRDECEQFNYFQERKAWLEKRPKNITDDLAQFLKTMILTDDSMREVMEEKELIEFKRKQLDFMTMGMLLKKPEKGKKKRKGKKREKSKKSKGKDKEIAKDLSYNVRPNEFMLMLEVVMNSLDVLEEVKRSQETQDESSLSKSSTSESSESSGSSVSEASDDEESDDEESDDEESDDVEDDDDD